MDNVIRIARSPSELMGYGLEYLVDSENNVIGRFYNGNLITDAPKGDQETTKTAV